MVSGIPGNYTVLTALLAAKHLTRAFVRKPRPSDVILVCVSLGISQVVFSPIAQGLLTGKYRPGEQPLAGSRATDEKAART